MWHLIALVFGLGLISGIIYYARKEVLSNARLDALKRELKERERATIIIDNVRRMSTNSVRDKLKETK